MSWHQIETYRTTVIEQLDDTDNYLFRGIDGQSEQSTNMDDLKRRIDELYPHFTLIFPAGIFPAIVIPAGLFHTRPILGFAIIVPPEDIIIIPEHKFWDAFIIFDADWIVNMLRGAFMFIPNAVWALFKSTLDNMANDYYERHKEE